jgi:acyl-coenzyme A thioesterase PaaI-like protein
MTQPTPAERWDLGSAQLRAQLNAWPTFAAQRIHVDSIADDWTRAVVSMPVGPDNGNYFGTAFGGSLFSMIDPFVVVLAAKQLGPSYAVWDQTAEIDFLRPGTGTVTAVVDMPAEVVASLADEARGGVKVLRWFEVPITGEDGTPVAVQRRRLYVRERR